ncbi:MAG TPA: DMT family transporter [Spirochaetia bacterium]|nr:DMT family transporter [Spirochaetia bacterium]
MAITDPENTGGRKSLDSMEGVPELRDIPVVKNRTMGPTEWVLIIILSVIWGSSFFFIKIIVSDVPPFTVVLGRVGLAAIALNIIVYAKGYRMPKNPSIWKDFILMGMLNNLIPFSLIIWGETRIASGLASILNATTPFFSVILAHFLTRDERLTGMRLGGILLGIIGVTVTIGWGSLGGLGLHLFAEVGVILAAFSYALAGIFGRRFQNHHPLVTATGQVTATAVLALPIAFAADRPWTLPWPGYGAVGAFIGLGLLCTALAYIIYFRILKVAGATNVLLVTLLIPVSALILGITILGERFQYEDFLGMALILLGLAAIDGRLFLWIKTSRAAHSRTPACLTKPENGAGPVGASGPRA